MSFERILALAMVTCALALGSATAGAADIKVLTTGAFRPALLALQPGFEAKTGHKLTIVNDPVGALVKRIDGGETFDVAIITPGVIDDLAKKGKIASGSRVDLAKVGVGVAVKQGAPKPDISSVEAFKKALLAAKAVGYIDPASGGSSGIYVDGLMKKLGIAEQIAPKAKLAHGGLAAELAASGEAEIVVAQISEILLVKGAALVGPLPAEIQNYTTYAGGLATATKDAPGPRALLAHLSGSEAIAVLAAKGLDKP